MTARYRRNIAGYANEQNNGQYEMLRHGWARQWHQHWGTLGNDTNQIFRNLLCLCICLNKATDDTKRWKCKIWLKLHFTVCDTILLQFKKLKQRIGSCFKFTENMKKPTNYFRTKQVFNISICYTFIYSKTREVNYKIVKLHT